MNEYYRKCKASELARLEKIRKSNQQSMPALIEFQKNILQVYAKYKLYKNLAHSLYKDDAIISHEDSLYYSKLIAENGDITDVIFLKDMVLDIDLQAVEKRILSCDTPNILFGAMRTYNGNYIDVEKIAEAIENCGEITLSQTLLNTNQKANKKELFTTSAELAV